MKTADRLATEAKVSRFLVQLAHQVQLQACAQLWALVLEGRASLVLAAEIVRLFPSHETQALVLEDVLAVPWGRRCRFVRKVAEMVAEQRAAAIVDAIANAMPQASQTDGETVPKTGSLAAVMAPKTGAFEAETHPKSGALGARP